MAQQRIGVQVTGPDSAAVLDGIVRAEAMGIPAAWLTTGGAGPDGLTVSAAAAALTERIMLGTSIVPTFPRHPVVMVQQAQVIASLAPGRFRLGVGPSGKAGTEAMFGVDHRAPLGHIGEYLRIARALLQEGSVDFDGRYYQAHGAIAAPVDVPVMASALGAKAFELCGALADGAISWVCPRVYLHDVGLPALRQGASGAGRDAPPLIAHTPVCVHDDADEAHEAVRRQFGNFARSPFYQNMFRAAGFAEAAEEVWSDAMTDAVALWGNEAQVAQGLEDLLAMGVTEVLASPVAAGDQREASLDRTLNLLAEANKKLGS